MSAAAILGFVLVVCFILWQNPAGATEMDTGSAVLAGAVAVLFAALGGWLAALAFSMLGDDDDG